MLLSVFMSLLDCCFPSFGVLDSLSVYHSRTGGLSSIEVTIKKKVNKKD